MKKILYNVFRLLFFSRASPIVWVRRNRYEYRSCLTSCTLSWPVHPRPFNPTLSISFTRVSPQVVCLFPGTGASNILLRVCPWSLLFPGTGASNILLRVCPSSLLLTCPYNFSLFCHLLPLLILSRVRFWFYLSSQLHTFIAASSSHSPPVSFLGFSLLIISLLLTPMPALSRYMSPLASHCAMSVNAYRVIESLHYIGALVPQVFWPVLRTGYCREGVSTIFPSTYVPRYRCSPVPMFPDFLL